jgi:hypothetical protein
VYISYYVMQLTASRGEEMAPSPPPLFLYASEMVWPKNCVSEEMTLILTNLLGKGISVLVL